MRTNTSNEEAPMKELAHSVPHNLSTIPPTSERSQQAKMKTYKKLYIRKTKPYQNIKNKQPSTPQTAKKAHSKKKKKINTNRKLNVITYNAHQRHTSERNIAEK